MAGIFKAYDVRGLYPSEVNEKNAEKIGYFFSKYLIEKYQGKKIVIGKDGRVGSTKLLNAFIKGASKTKFQITTINTCSTPALYYTCAKLNYDAGIMITASHNPKEYNGIKIVLKGAKPFDYATGFNKIEKMIEEEIPSKTYKKTIKKVNLDLYTNKITNLFKNKNLDKTNLKIIIDMSNGVTASTLPKVFKNLKIKYKIINKKIDKNFSGHDPNPYDPKNLKQLQKEVKKEKADIGIIFDGDGDRVFFIDEKSNILDSATSGEILINYLLKNSKKASKTNFTFDVRTSKSVIDLIKHHKTKFFVSKVGHSNIKRTMAKKDSILGFENSGHFMHKFLYNIDDALYTALLMIQVIAKRDEKLSIIKNNFSDYFSINKDFKTKFKNSKELIKAIEKKYKTAKTSKLDGISLTFENWWCNIRTSNTEPVVRLFIEGINKKIVNQKMKEIVNLVKA